MGSLLQRNLSLEACWSAEKEQPLYGYFSCFLLEICLIKLKYESIKL